MSIHSDIPTWLQVELLMADRNPQSVSIYLPLADLGHGQRTDRRNQLRLGESAAERLREGGADEESVKVIEETLLDLVDDDEFWSRQAETLAVFATL